VQGQGKAGIAQMRQGLASSGAAGTGLGKAPVMAQLAEAYCIAGQTPEGLHAIDQARAAMETTGERWWAAETYRIQGALLLQADSASQLAACTPKACFQKAIDVARQQQAKSWELCAALSLARLWQQQGRRDYARDLLAPITHAFTEGFGTTDVQDANALLDRLKS
jgi:predicted ATPase